jgi:hypothetical protein
VTVALNYLEERGIISLARKKILITDRKALMAFPKPWQGDTIYSKGTYSITGKETAPGNA